MSMLLGVAAPDHRQGITPFFTTNGGKRDGVLTGKQKLPILMVG